MKAYLEHANISVSDLAKGVKFFKTAFPDYYIRGKGKSRTDWVHFGNQETYIALNIASVTKDEDDRYVRTGFNHLGFVVDNVNELASRMLAAGYKRSYPRQEQRTRIREYFFDADGNEYEFVEYLSDNWSDRNSYDD